MSEKYLVMGVTSCGKSSIGKAFANKISARFIDGDDLHPPSNIAKMKNGIPLTDLDRAPWLDEVGRALVADNERVVITCSALKRAYRDRITAQAGRSHITFILLDGTRELLAERMAARQGHFMPLSLLDSQIATLEYPHDDENALIVSIDQPEEKLVDTICAEVALRLKSKLSKP